MHKLCINSPHEDLLLPQTAVLNRFHRNSSPLLWLIVLDQPLDKSALKDVAEGNHVALSGPHQQLVPSSVGFQIGQVLVMRLLLPCNACGAERTSGMALIMQKVMQALHL